MGLFQRGASQRQPRPGRQRGRGQGPAQPLAEVLNDVGLDRCPEGLVVDGCIAHRHHFPPRAGRHPDPPHVVHLCGWGRCGCGGEVPGSWPEDSRTQRTREWQRTAGFGFGVRVRVQVLVNLVPYWYPGGRWAPIHPSRARATAAPPGQTPLGIQLPSAEGQLRAAGSNRHWGLTDHGWGPTEVSRGWSGYGSSIPENGGRGRLSAGGGGGRGQGLLLCCPVWCPLLGIVLTPLFVPRAVQELLHLETFPSLRAGDVRLGTYRC